MNGRVPTERQYEWLRRLDPCNAIVVAGVRDTEPFLRRGWVTADEHGEGRNRHYAWVRITAEGLRALAAAVERYGLPELPNGYTTHKVCADCGSENRVCAKCGSDLWRWENRSVQRASANSQERPS